MAWTDAGTVSVTNGSAAVVGTSTDFITGAQVGDAIHLDEVIYEIASIQSATALTLGKAYLGGTNASLTYEIVPTRSLTKTLATSVETLITDYATVKNTVGSGLFPDGTAGVPSISFVDDTDLGFYRISANSMGLSGALTLPSADINGGTIDGTVIGGTTAAAGSFTTLGATGNLDVGGAVKISNATNSQFFMRDEDGTTTHNSVRWSLNADRYNLDVTDNAYSFVAEAFDMTLTSSGVSQYRFITGGATQSLIIDATGVDVDGALDVGGNATISNVSPTLKLIDTNDTGTATGIWLNSQADTMQLAIINSAGNFVADGYKYTYNDTGPIRHYWNVGATEAAHLDASGLDITNDLDVGGFINSATAGSTFGGMARQGYTSVGTVQIGTGTGGAAGLLIHNDPAQSGYISFGDGAVAGRFQYDHATDVMTVQAAAVTQMTLDGTGVDITNDLDVGGNTTLGGNITQTGTGAVIHQMTGDSTSEGQLKFSSVTAARVATTGTVPIILSTNGVTRMAVDGSTGLVTVNDDLDVGGDVTVDGFLKFGPLTELTIATGVITVTQTRHSVDTEADAATDDLTTINGGVDGAMLILRAANDGRTVVVKDGGNIQLAGGDFSLSHRDDKLVLMYESELADWTEISRSDNSA